MDKSIKIFLIVFGIAILISILFLNDDVVVGEQLCVDGNNNINLEGIICENSEYKIDGLSSRTSVLVNTLLVITGLLIYGYGLFALSENSE